MRQLILVVAAVVMFGGSTSAAERVELTRNPGLLLKPDFRSRAVTVYGIGIGDAVASIPAADISSREESTIYLKSGISLAVEDGKVLWIVVPTPLFEKWDLKLRSVDDVKASFGKPDDTKESESSAFGAKSFTHEYEYRERGIVVFVYLPNKVGVRLK